LSEKTEKTEKTESPDSLDFLAEPVRNFEVHIRYLFFIASISFQSLALMSQENQIPVVNFPTMSSSYRIQKEHLIKPSKDADGSQKYVLAANSISLNSFPTPIL